VDCSGSHSGSEEAGPIMTLRKRPCDPAQLCVSINAADYARDGGKGDQAARMGVVTLHGSV
jgi:hypothetical protein